jgi:hypothetical protein
MNLLEKIQKSNTTLIGYDAQNEISVEKLLRFLPSVTLFENVESIEILEHFNSLAHFRDYKLDSLLNDNSVNYIVVDLSSIYFNEGNEIGDNFRERRDQETFSKVKFIKELQSRVYTLSNNESLVNFKLILLTNIYVTMSPMSVQVEFRGGMNLMYVADLAVKFLGDTVSIEKDRFDSDYSSRIVKQELREISINSIFDEITTTT